MKNGFLRSFADSRKMKYSTINVVFCALVIAIVIMLNSIVSVLSGRFGWYIDMTQEQIFTLSDDARDMLDGINDEVELEIVFPFDKDKLNVYGTTESYGSIGYIHSTAQQIAEACDNVTVSYHDVDTDYLFYKEAGVLGKAGEENILILRKTESGKYAEGDFRVYPINWFYVNDENGSLYGYNGEKIFMSALVALAENTTPMAYFTIGHSEDSFEKENVEITYENIYKMAVEGAINPKSAELMLLLTECGFNVKAIDLMTQEIPEDARMIFINQPKSDFDIQELYKLETYLGVDGIVFCFTPHDAELPNLYKNITSWSGVTVNTNATPVEDASTQFANTKYTLLANVSSTHDYFATSKYFSSLKSYSSAKARFFNTGVLSVDEQFITSEGFNIGQATKRYTYPLLETTQKAVFNGNSGVQSLMTITSTEHFYAGVVGEAYSEFSYLVVCPSSEFASTAYLGESSYPNRKMIMSLIQATSTMQTPVNIDYKTFMDYDLDITDRQAQTATALLATVIPALAIICGVVIIVRRKNR